MYGNLFIYDDQNKLVAFQSGSSQASRYFIFLGGLTDGFFAVPYLEKLSIQLETTFKDYCLVQVLLRSSYLQYGWHSIDDDVEDLQKLIDYLTIHRTNLQSIVLMGHSTGCQDIVHYLRQKKTHPKIVRVFLQGPVSDRQYLSRLDSTKDQLNYCHEHNQDQSEWLPRSLHDPPLSIERCRSLNEKNSLEDLFSSDLTDEDLRKIYEHIEVPISWIWSAQDQYVPDDLKEEMIHFVRNKLATKTNSTVLVLEEADHAVQHEKEQNIMIQHVLHVISQSQE